MKNSLRLAFAYFRFYKKQTLTLFLGMLLTISMLAGIGSLLYSGRNASLENAREKYGDWHYSLRCDYPWFKEFQKQKAGKGYKVVKSGVLTIRKVIDKPYQITLAYADRGYLKMMGRKMIKGNYPKQKNEVAMDPYTLRNLSIPQKLGSKVKLEGEEFVLSGIVSDMPAEDSMQVFVSDKVDYGKNGKFLYLKFDESGRVNKQAEWFVKAFGISVKSLRTNNALLSYIGGGSRAGVWDTIKAGWTMKGGGLPYVWNVLNEDWNLTEKAVLGALGLFGIFIIYSLFQMSVVKRMSQYSMMQAVGMGDLTTFIVLVSELSAIFLIAFPIGCILGNGAAALLYQKAGQIFVVSDSFTVHSGDVGEQVKAAASMPAPGQFQVSANRMADIAVFMLIFILLLAWTLVRRMKKMTVRALLAKEMRKKQIVRKIYSQKRGSLTGVLTRKFMFHKIGTFAGIVISLSIGGLIFLGTAYVTGNTKINNNLTFKADDGLGSDIQVFEDSDKLSEVIPEDTVTQLQNMKELKSVSPVQYMLGEIPLQNGRLRWTNYFAEVAHIKGFEPNPALMERYHGVATQTGKNDYRLKVNIYGYDDHMLGELQEYLLKGKADPDEMRKDNTVIFKTLMGGQGTYGGIDIGVGDTVKLKTPINSKVPPEVLRFQSDANQYQEKKFKITAIASRPLAKVDTYIGDDGTDIVDIIMTNEQMKENFGVGGCQTVSIQLKQGADAAKVSDEIRKITEGIPKCVVKDYTPQIERQNLFLKQKMLFFYGVALILLGISFLHIMNSMQYLVIARKQEFGILRAMGITDSGFRRMLVKEGIKYGAYSGAVMVVLYLALQKVLYYFLVHIFLYQQPKELLNPVYILVMVLVNLGICTCAVLISGQSVLREQIIDEIQIL